MTAFERIEALETKITALEAALAAIPVATTPDLAALTEKVDGIRTDLGTPTVTA